MANVMLTKGGPYRFNLNGLARQRVYDGETHGAACRVAGEYMHGFFTVGNSFNPMHSIGQDEAIDSAKVKVGDFIGLFEVPTHHTLIDVAAKTVPHQTERGYPGVANSAGLVFELEVRKLNAETDAEVGTVELVSPMTGLVASDEAFKRSAVKPTDGGYFIPTGEYLVIGLKVTALPTDTNVKLSEVTSRVEVTGHVYDYEAPIHV